MNRNQQQLQWKQIVNSKNFKMRTPRTISNNNNTRLYNKHNKTLKYIWIFFSTLKKNVYQVKNTSWIHRNPIKHLTKVNKKTSTSKLAQWRNNGCSNVSKYFNTLRVYNVAYMRASWGRKGGWGSIPNSITVVISRRLSETLINITYNHCWNRIYTHQFT